jgi:acetyl esterase/lipase
MTRAISSAAQDTVPPARELSLTFAEEIASDASVDGIRFVFDQLAGLLNRRLPQVGAFHERIPVDTAGHAVPVDVIVPNGNGPFPVLLYCHGGAWVAGNPASHRKLTFRFAERGFLVVSVDYRLAPEYPFPAGFDDCCAALRWTVRNAHRFGGDPARLAIGGDSAGGNLAAAVAIHCAQRPREPRIAAAVLIYGVFDFADVGGPLFSGALREAYLGRKAGDDLLRDHRVSPIHGAAQLPPSLVIVGSQDPLLADSKALAVRLTAAGVRHELVVASGMPHGYVQMEFFGNARRSIDTIASFLERELAPRHRHRVRRFALRLRAAVGEAWAWLRRRRRPSNAEC